MDYSTLTADRLNFTLPDFTRLSWVSMQAQNVWAPRLRRITWAWSEIEWRSVSAGVRPCSYITLTPATFRTMQEQWAGYGLEAAVIQEVGASPHLPYTSTPPPVEPGKPTMLRVAVGTREIVSQFVEAWAARDNYAIGGLLGYPPCCQWFFQQTWVKARCLDTTWAMALNMAAPKHEGRMIEVDGPLYANILWRWMGVRAVPHLPCSFACRETVTLGERLEHIGRQLGFDEEMDWTREILSWPVEWSALHGIAEVKTPVVKVATRTDATAHKYVVRWRGDTFPSEGALGLDFPYRRPSRLHVTTSRSYKRGLAQSVQIQTSQPAWYHQDNSFSTRYAMDSLHEPIVHTARQVLTDAEGAVLDLGCGNGALLAKICLTHENLTPYGIDTDSSKLAHARLILPHFTANFVEGDFFMPECWPSVEQFALVLLMVGRLLEVPQVQAERLLEILRTRCNRLVVYVYPGWSQDTLAALAERARLQLKPPIGVSVAAAAL